MSQRNILVLTSAIAPQSGVHALARANPADRLGDYLRALDFYLPLVAKGVFDALVYVDNSGYPLDEHEAKAKVLGVEDATEFVSYVSEVPPYFSRYYLEANLLLEGIKRSATLKKASEEVLWKVTGRYIVENIEKIVATQPARFDLYLNLRNHPYRVVDFFLVGARATAFESLLQRDIEAFRVREDGEIILRQRIDAGYYEDIEIVPRLRVTPRLFGVRGFDGAAYGGFRHALKFHLRRAATHIVPWLWI